jgi:hypothetical protein
VQSPQAVTAPSTLWESPQTLESLCFGTF